MYDPSDLYVDPILTGFSTGYQDQQLFGERLMPITPVTTETGKYRVFDRSDWIIFPSRRTVGTVANEVRGRKWSTDSFFVKEHSLQSPVFDEERQAYQSSGGLSDPAFGGDLTINPERDAVALITRSILLEHELKVSALIRNSANYAGNHTVTLSGTSKWSDYTGGVSHPVTNIKTAVQRIYLDTGRWPNTMIIPFDAVGVIENHPDVVARYQYTSVLDPNAWRVMMGLPEGVANQLNVFVVDSMYNTADNIEAAESIASFWGQDVWIGIVDQKPGQETKTFGKTFAQIYPDGSTKPTDRWREPQRKADLFRTSFKYDLKIVSATAGYLIKNAVAAVT